MHWKIETHRFPGLALLLASTVLFLSPSSEVAAGQFKDSRSFAMGGTGVASARPTAAPFHNPALLAVPANKNEHFGIILPSVSFELSDSDDLLKEVQDFADDDLLGDFNNAIDAFNSNPSTQNLQNVVNTTRAMNNSLLKMDDGVAALGVGVGTAIAIPNKILAAAVYLDSSMTLSATANYADADQQAVQDVIDAIQDNINGIPTLIPPIDPATFKSSAHIIGVAITELGVSLAHRFTLGDIPLSIGVTPKYQRIDSYDYTQTVDNTDFDDWNNSDNHANDNHFNVDLGMQLQFKKLLNLQLGLVGKNLISGKFKTVNGHEFELKPLAQFGMAFGGGWYTVAADIDLTKTESFGFERDQQLASVGAEFDVFGWMQARAGLRHNFADNNWDNDASDTAVTAGLGFTPFGFGIDLSGLYAGTNEYGASLQLGFQF